MLIKTPPVLAPKASNDLAFRPLIRVTKDSLEPPPVHMTPLDSCSIATLQVSWDRS